MKPDFKTNEISTRHNQPIVSLAMSPRVKATTFNTANLSPKKASNYPKRTAKTLEDFTFDENQSKYNTMT